MKTTTTLHHKYQTSETELRALKIEYPMRLANLETQIVALKEQIEEDALKLRKNRTKLKLIPTLEEKCNGLTEKLSQAVDDGTRLRDENTILRVSIQKLEISLAEKIDTIATINSDLEDQKQIDQQLMNLMEKKKSKKK